VSISIDISAQLAWAIANTEAFLAGERRIRPAHFLLGILKVIDSSFAKQIATLGISEEQQKRLVRTGVAARHYLEMSPKDITLFRRRLRKRLRTKSGPTHHEGAIPVLHRSDESRAVFASLAHRATASRLGSVTALTLLEELVLSRRIDLESLWQEVVKGHKQAPNVKPQEHGWSIGRESQVVHEEGDRSLTESALPAALDGHGRNLTLLAKNARLRPVIGRKREVAAVARLLHRVNKRSVLLVGPPGVGKTSIVEALAQKLCRPSAPKALRATEIVHITAGELLIAISAEGRDTVAIRTRLDALTNTEGLILAVEDMDRLLKPEATFEPAAELARNAVAKGHLACVGTTTEDGYEVMRKSHASFTETLNSLLIHEMSDRDCLAVAKMWAESIALHHGVEFAEGTVEYAVELASTSIGEGVLPAKAIDLLENAAVLRRIPLLSSTQGKKPRATPTVRVADLLEVLREQYGIDIAASDTNEAP